MTQTMNSEEKLEALKPLIANVERLTNELKVERLIFEATAEHMIDRLCDVLHDLLGPWDGRDPETDGPIALETDGASIRKAQAVLAEVE